MTTQFNLNNRTVTSSKGTNGGLNVPSLIATMIPEAQRDIAAKVITLASNAQELGEISLAQSLLQTMFEINCNIVEMSIGNDKAEITDLLKVEIIALSKLGNASVTAEFSPVDYSQSTIADLDKSVVSRMGDIAKLGNGAELMMAFMSGTKEIKLGKIAEIDKALWQFAQDELRKAQKDGTVYLLQIVESQVKNSVDWVAWGNNSTVIGLANLDAVKTFIQEKSTGHSVPKMEFPQSAFVAMGYSEITVDTATSLKQSQVSDKFKSMRTAIVMSQDFTNETQRTAALDELKAAKDTVISYLGSIA